MIKYPHLVENVGTSKEQIAGIIPTMPQAQVAAKMGDSAKQSAQYHRHLHQLDRLRIITNIPLKHPILTKPSITHRMTGWHFP